MSVEQVKPWGSLNWPNRITIVRLLLVAPFVILLMDHQRWPPARHLALGIFMVMGLSDWLDGLLARRMGARTRLGAILDPLADKVLIICSLILLSRPGSAVPGAELPDYVVVAIVGKDLWVIVGFVVIYLVTDRLRVQPTRAGKACTVGQILMVILVLISPELNRLGGRAGSRVALAAAWAAAALSVLAVVGYTRLGLRFIAREQRPLEENEKSSHGDH